jgi:hypothetical protein
MAADSLQKQRKPRGPGRPFEKGESGNPAGREPGTRNRATVLAEQLFDGASNALAIKAVAMALAGDTQAMKLCIGRIIAPRRHRPVAFTLPPLRTAADLAPAMTAIAAAVGDGALSSGEAWELAQIVDTFIRTVEAGEFEARLQRLEAVNGITALGSPRAPAGGGDEGDPPPGRGSPVPARACSRGRDDPRGVGRRKDRSGRGLVPGPFRRCRAAAGAPRRHPGIAARRRRLRRGAPASGSRRGSADQGSRPRGGVCRPAATRPWRLAARLVRLVAGRPG